MIPKIIHYCWFGPNKKSPEFEKYLTSWKQNLPDYEIIEWNESNFDYNRYLYSREAFRMSCYAHVSDVCRIHVLHEIGGIYLDTDVEVLKSFDNFLKFDSFVGTEFKYIGTGDIASKPGMKWLKSFLEYYADRHFINRFGHPRRRPNTKILTTTILPRLDANTWPAIFPKDYFCGKDWTTGQSIITENTVSLHHYEASWRRKRSLSDKIKILLKGIKARYSK